MKESYKEFVKQIIFWGRFTLLAAWICSFLPPLYLAVVYGIMPEVTSIVKAFSMIASVMLVSWIVEPIAYFPIVGITGTYMSWLAEYFQYACTGIGAFTDSRRCRRRYA